MFSVFVFILVLVGIYLAFEAVVLTALAEAYTASYKMLFLVLIFIVFGFYIYLTRFNTYLVINL